MKQEEKVLFVDQYEQLLNDLAVAASGGVDTKEVAKRLIARLCQTFSTSLVKIFILDNPGEFLLDYSDQDSDQLLKIPVKTSLAGYIVETGQPIRVGEIDQAPRYYQINQNIHSALGAPLRFRSKDIGVLMVESPEHNRFTMRDEQLLMTIASLLAGLFENVRLNQELHKWANDLDLIHLVAMNIVGLTDEYLISQVTAELMAEYFKYEFTTILFVEEGGKNFICAGVGGTKAKMIKRGRKFSTARGITGKVYRSGRSHYTNDAPCDPDYYSIPGWEAGSEICVPILEGDQVIALINLERAEKNVIKDADLILLESLAGMLSSVLLNARRDRVLLDFSESLIVETEVEALQKLIVNGIQKNLCCAGVGIYQYREPLHTGKAVNRNDLNYQFELLSWCGTIPALDLNETGSEPFVNGIIKNHTFQLNQNNGTVGGGHIFLGSHSLEDLISARVCLNRSWITTRTDPTNLGLVEDEVKSPVVEPVCYYIIAARRSTEGKFTQADLEVFQILTHQASVALDNAYLYSQLRDTLSKVKESQRALIQAEKMTAAGRLTASIAHEINNPLQSLNNCLYLLEKEDLSSEAKKKYLGLARNELDHLVTIVQQMLDFYRPGVKDRKLIEMNDLAVRVVEMVKQQLSENRVEIHLKLAPDLPPVMVVPSQIQQVFINLILNALEAMEDGGDLTIQTRAGTYTFSEPSEGSLVYQPNIEILFKDSGPGVSESELDRIFEPFVSTKEDGTGLGLSVSYGIIAAHGGTIRLLQKPGEGACFIISLPQRGVS